MALWRRLSLEWTYGLAVVRLLLRLRRIVNRPERTICEEVADLARRHGDRPALIGETSRLTYRELDQLANRYARWARAAGVGKGDVVALLMGNKPDFVAAWIGIARAGGVTALLNTNQRGSSLAHSLTIAGPGHIILDAELAGVYDGACAHLANEPKVWTAGGAGPGESLDHALAGLSGLPLEAGERARLTTDDPCLYIYTSGTTGLPKAARISHYRVMAIMNGFSSVVGAQASDRIYVPLPLYHSSGGLIGVGAALTAGGAAIIPTAFSTRQFWRDCVRHEATLFQYIGELCRYLVHAPPCEDERRHTLRLACGNGLRPDIWRRFAERFAIPRVVEFYGATEGNVLLVNFDGHEGALGRLPGWARRIFRIELVTFDSEAGRPARDAAGRCRRARPGEVGEAIGSIERDPRRPTSRFDGYANAAETEAKILRDVFAPGDMWFRSGDLMRIDEQDYLYFVDRVGDTFRWKGENVSTSEVAAAIAAFDGIAEASVYGVTVPGHDGRAGMAKLAPIDGDVDLAGLARHLGKVLPRYAAPVFLRVGRDIEKTSTFKQQKTALIAEGYDPARVADALFFADPASGTYVPLDAESFRKINLGTIRI